MIPITWDSYSLLSHTDSPQHTHLNQLPEGGSSIEQHKTDDVTRRLRPSTTTTVACIFNGKLILSQAFLPPQKKNLYSLS